MAEFFVRPEFRRSGLGKRATINIWKLHPGQWQVRVLAAHTAADAFWQHAIKKMAHEDLPPIPRLHKEQIWNVYQFDV